MIDDIFNGAVLPPVVIGAVMDNVNYSDFFNMNDKELISWLISHAENLSLIDGMQRTAAMMDASQKGNLSTYEIRFEFWLTRSADSLIYRMLVLNARQGAQDIRRQLESVFDAVIKQIKQNDTNISIFSTYI